METQGPLFTSCGFHVSDNTALKGLRVLTAQGPDCTGHMPAKLALATQVVLAAVILITVSSSRTPGGFKSENNRTEF